MTNLQTIIPISHIHFLRTSPLNTSSSHIARYTESVLTRRLTALRPSLIFVRPTELQAKLSSQLSQAVQRARTAADDQIPDLIACFFDGSELKGFSPHTQHKDREHQRSRSGIQRIQSFRRIQAGQVCTFWYIGQSRTGFISAIYRDGLIVRIAVTANSEGIRWQKVLVHPHQIRGLWSTPSILILPLARLSTTPNSS